MLAISEIEIVAIKPQNGLVAFASFVINNSIYFGSVGIMSRPNGEYRLLYPTKLVAGRQLDVFHPISKDAGQQIQDAVITKFEDVVKNGRNRYDSAYPAHN
jgi:DNA-binding cell septation regulator SpoVG